MKYNGAEAARIVDLVNAATSVVCPVNTDKLIEVEDDGTVDARMVEFYLNLAIKSGVHDAGERAELVAVLDVEKTERAAR